MPLGWIAVTDAGRGMDGNQQQLSHLLYGIVADDPDPILLNRQIYRMNE